MADPFEVHELAADECWALIAASSVARVAFVLDGRPRLFPVNIVRDGASVVFRTAADGELGATAGAPVAVEVDGYDPSRMEAWSVVVDGAGRAVTDPDELAEVGGLALFPWHVGAKDLFVRVEADAISGRRFRTPYAGPSGFLR